MDMMEYRASDKKLNVFHDFTRVLSTLNSFV